jgi:hypothetical protein
LIFFWKTLHLSVFCCIFDSYKERLHFRFSHLQRPGSKEAFREVVFDIVVTIKNGKCELTDGSNVCYGGTSSFPTSYLFSAEITSFMRFRNNKFEGWNQI